MSLPRTKLYERALWGLEQQYRDRLDSKEFEILKFLWHQVIMDDPVRGARRRGNLADWDKLPANKSLFCQPAGKGIVIGNLTSQLLSNIYLDMLDRYIYFDLGYKHYGRYVDDFYIIVPDKDWEHLKQDIPQIAEFLRLKGLTLHPTKRYMQPVQHGVPFLGAVVYYNHIVPDSRLKKNMSEAFGEVMMGIRGLDTVTSYLGHLKHFKSEKLILENFAKVGWDYIL